MEAELRNQFLNILQNRFNKEELRDLAFHILGPGSYDDLVGDTHKEKAISLLEFLARHERTDDLLDYIKRTRRDVKLLAHPARSRVDEQPQPPVRVRITVCVEMTPVLEFGSLDELVAKVVQEGYNAGQSISEAGVLREALNVDHTTRGSAFQTKI